MGAIESTINQRINESFDLKPRPPIEMQEPQVNEAASPLPKRHQSILKPTVNIDNGLNPSFVKLETELDKIHQRSTRMLKSLGCNPCEELTARVTRCLQNNAEQMEKSFSLMNSYTDSVREEMKKKLMSKLLEKGN